MIALWVTLLVLSLALGWALNLLGMPGNWLMVVAVALYAWLAPEGGVTDLSWLVVAAVAALACLGELLEFVAGSLGAARAGGSKRGAVLALAGSVAGGIVGIFVGTPIPVLGSLVAALILACVGALAGAMLGERWAGQDMEQSWRVGQAAFWGRMFGTLAKTLVASLMVVLSVAALCL